MPCPSCPNGLPRHPRRAQPSFRNHERVLKCGCGPGSRQMESLRVRSAKRHRLSNLASTRVPVPQLLTELVGHPHATCTPASEELGQRAGECASEEATRLTGPDVE